METLATGEGVIVSIEGEKAAVTRDANAELIAVSASCTHMGCTVAWNDAESTWDCPCHGSRFARNGASCTVRQPSPSSGSSLLR